MPSINLTDHQLVMLASAISRLLDADETIGLLASEADMEYPTLDPEFRRYLASLAADLEAVAREHHGGMGGLPPILAERVYVLEDVKRYANRVGERETCEYCDLNVKLIRAAEEL